MKNKKFPLPARSSPVRTRRNPIPQQQPAIIGLLQSISRRGKNPDQTKGAFGHAQKSREWREGFIAESQRQAIQLASEKSLRQAYAKFYATPEGRAFAQEHGATVDSRSYRADKRNGLDFADPADLPESVGCGAHNGRKLVRNVHPHLEPEAKVQIDGLDQAQIREASETFGELIRWALDDIDLVGRGRRAQVMIAAIRPDLAIGWSLVRELQLDLLQEVASEHFTASGDVFGPYLEWMRRSPTISGFGERLDMTAYMLRPDLLPENTLAKLGAILNKSRQAKDKLAGCARDTFAGLKAPAMRPEVTRDRCRAAQVRGALPEAIVT